MNNTSFITLYILISDAKGMILPPRSAPVD